MFHVHLTKLYSLFLLRYLESCPPHSHLFKNGLSDLSFVHMAAIWSRSVIFPNLIFEEYRTQTSQTSFPHEIVQEICETNYDICKLLYPRIT